MSRQQSLLDPDDRIVEVDIAERMEQSFLDYSMSVIVGRALPDVRDGLKPVQRRILHAMEEAALRPDRPHRKCASVVGDVMKKYHPHGDTSIYDALVRMAQDFSLRDPLIDGRGNFGSIDGDPPAAHRYTECRLTPLAMDLLAGIHEDTVDFGPNYDGFEVEPLVLPARFPNLVVNGASGIAVGMATNVPPHNLAEAIDACLLLMRRPQASIEAVLELLPAPDFPTGARIPSTEGVRDAYLTGRGAIPVEAVAATETRSGGLPRIVVTEIPFQVNKAAMLERIAELVKSRKLEEVRDLRDESSRDGMRIVIELKRGEDPAAVLRRLYAMTELRKDFNVNFVALVDGEPRTLGIREALLEYLRHQRVVLRRRTTHRRDRAAARAHVLEGLLLALDHLDEVIRLIRAAASADAARTGLMDRFGMSEVQATAVLDMQLRRLAALERHKLEDEHRELAALLEELEAILADPTRLDALLSDELRDVRERHATPRRTRIADAGVTTAGAPAGDGHAPVLEAQPVTVAVTAGGVLRAVARRRTSAAHDRPSDPLVSVIRAATGATLLLVDRDGMGYRVDVGDIPVTTPKQRGLGLAQLLGTAPGALIAGAVVLDVDAGDGASVVTASARGIVKRTAVEEYLGRARSMIAAGLRDDDDAIVGVAACTEEDELLVAGSHGQVIRFRASDVRPMGRSASGVAGLALPRGAEVASITVVGGDDPADVLTLAADGAVKRAPLDDYPVQGRGGKGVQAGVAGAVYVGPAVDLHVETAEGWTVLRADTVPAGGRRAARGVPTVGDVQGRAVAEVTAGDG